MKSPLALIGLFALLLISQPSLSGADCNNPGGNSGQAKCRKDDCKDLVKEKPKSGESGEKASPPTPGSPPTAGSTPSSPASPASSASPATVPASSEEFDCTFVEALLNISVLLTVDEQVIFQEFIEEIQVDILEDVTLTDEEKVVKCSYKLKHFLDANYEIEQVIAFQEIDVWGSFFDFTYVSHDLQADIADSVDTLDANDDCVLFEALLNATRNDSAKYQATLVLIEELKVVLLDFTWTHAQKKAKLHLLFKEFFDAHASWKSFFLSIEIEGFGSFESYDDVCHGYSQALSISSVLVGSSDSDCPVLKALADAYANTSFTITVRNQIKQFHDKLVVFFASEKDVDKRLAYVSAQYWQLIIMESWIVQYMSVVSIKDMSGNDWGLFYDLIWCSQFCNNTGSCGCMSCGLGSADCASRANLIAITAENTTILTDVLTTNYNSWNSTTKMGFNSCFNQVRGAIWNATATVAQKIDAIVGYFKAYNANNKWKQQVLFNITIDVWDGEIVDFVNCGTI